MTGLLARVLAGLLRRCDGLFGPGRRDWVQAMLTEANEIQDFPATCEAPAMTSPTAAKSAGGLRIALGRTV